MDHVQGNGGGTSIAKILQAIRYPIQREPQFLGEEIRHETVGLMEVDHIHIFDPHIQDFQYLLYARGNNPKTKIEDIHSTHVQLLTAKDIPHLIHFSLKSLCATRISVSPVRHAEHIRAPPIRMKHETGGAIPLAFLYQRGGTGVTEQRCRHLVMIRYGLGHGLSHQQKDTSYPILRGQGISDG